MTSAPEPTFTVVMPAYDRAATIDSAIASVLAQTRPDFELIVVDDGSTDDTAARVTAAMAVDPRIELVRQENRGPTAARNAAFERARGRYVSLLDSDDLWLPGYLERIGAALDAEPAAGFAYSDAWVLDDRTRKIRRSSALAHTDPPDPLPRDPTAFLVELLRINFVYGSATVRRTVLEEVGGMDAGLRASEDYELWLRILAHGHRALAVPGRLSVYRRRHDSISADFSLVLRTKLEVMRRIAEEWDVGDEVRSAARRSAAEAEAELAAVGGANRLGAARLRARLLAGRAYRTVMSRRLWYSTPPPEVAAAFPDLRSV